MANYIQHNSDFAFFLMMPTDVINLKSSSLIAAFTEAIANGYDVDQTKYVNDQGCECDVMFKVRGVKR